jgi:hypothetical protein
MTINANVFRARTWAIRSGVTAVIVTTLMAVSTHTAKLEIPEGFAGDPLTVVRVFNDTLNSKMIDAGLGLVDDNVLFIDATGQAHYGKSFVRSWMQSQVWQNDQSEISDLWISTDTVTWTARIHSGDSRQLAKSEAVIRGGKIVSLKALRSQ